MSKSSPGAYDPSTFEALRFTDARQAFESGADSPSDYLERCIASVEEREPVVRAFAARNDELARDAAKASTERWRAGHSLSPIDGMPIAIKDLLETTDMPTEMGCEAYRGNFPRRDNAAVWALRAAGAVVFGKTVTAELGGSHPGATTNPFHPDHTPGGSSSGSAAAVAARMVPAAIGTQVGGSIIRPAGYCGNFALKPTQGGINRGERQATSMSTHGVHAGCIEDMWQVAIEIARRAGGDRGCLGLVGPQQPPESRRPDTLIVLETEGWVDVDDDTKRAFATIVESLAGMGVQVIGRREHVLVEHLEEAIGDARATCSAITSWENRWAQRNLVNENPAGVSDRAKATLAKAELMTPDDYRIALMKRDAAQRAHAEIGAIADACITLSCPGPAPLWLGDKPGEPLAPRPTGDAVFNTPSSMMFAPVVTIPLMGVQGLPVGVQVMGRPHDDARVTGLARWLSQHLDPVCV